MFLLVCFVLCACFFFSCVRVFVFYVLRINIAVFIITAVLCVDEDSLAELRRRDPCGCGKFGAYQVLTPARLPRLLLSLQQH
jgi:hypothetical protein